ncbi:uncharacterized protein FOMMEDRAFT_143378 [Fomitiporia mediterranea MF3/22]|uniref:uncharacterized protein n=1 Tax=Fomitiporia mediterranea (strain MF3/22) TaxID=694068 RepID=UPI0004407D6F|nr:uncharacterized protein FOMMEDRAFT_143378 [Fomitiporia mediterranea MF3/22]EJC97824.1 hypothetical protein FOMMEDRAFT_143378 [Fomitiporia mediterranea MF3/22]
MDVVYTPDATDNEPQTVLDTVEGEIHFFRALMRARPVGINRHFHVMSIQAAIEKGTKQSVSVDEIWRKLESCYNLEALEALEAEYESGNNTQSDSSTPQPTASPKEGDNLQTHPFFREEFSLPPDGFIESLQAERRIRATESPMSTASPAPARNSSEGASKRGRKRKASNEPSKADLAGLVSGDSDSSDLTQQSGDEGDETNGQAQTPSEKRATSAASGTDGDTDNAEEEEEEKGEDEARRTRRGRKPVTRARGRTIATRKRKR